MVDDSEPRRGAEVSGTETPARALGQHPSAPMRVGSPFAKAIVQTYYTAEEAVRRESAAGGVLASAWLMLFVLMCLLWFPLGAALIAPIGLFSSFYGLLSRYRKAAIGFALAHGASLAWVLAT